MSGIDHQEKRKEAKEKIKNIFVFSFFYIKQLKTCWKGQTMEDIKINNDKLNEAIKRNDLPEVPRTPEGKIDIEKISIGKDSKGYIIPDNIFDSYLKELPEGTTNESQTFRAYNGGKLTRLENNTQEASRRGLAGAISSNTTQAARRSIKEILEELSRRTVTAEEAEEYGMEEGTSLLEAASLAQFRRAMKGDTKAAEYVRDTLGEKPADKISAEIETITPEDRKQIERILNRTKAQDIVVGKDQE